MKTMNYVKVLTHYIHFVCSEINSQLTAITIKKAKNKTNTHAVSINRATTCSNILFCCLLIFNDTSDLIDIQHMAK